MASLKAGAVPAAVACTAESASAASSPCAIKVILVTDIGRDIDDTIAILVCISLHVQKKIELRGIVGTGGAGFARACISRWWLRRCGIPDSEVRVAADFSAGMEACFVPEGVLKCPFAGPVPKNLACEATVDLEYDPDDKNPNPAQRRQRPKPTKRNAVIFALDHDAHGFDKGGALILSAANSFKKQLQLTCIAPMSPVKKAMLGADGKPDAACVKSLQGIGKVLVQGQAIEKPEGLLPDKQAFNLRQDMDAANFCFEYLQKKVPFSLLGKFAAYKVSLYRKDFAMFDKIVASGRPAAALSFEQANEMTLAAKANLNIFRVGNPSLFYNIYHVAKKDQNESDWFKNIQVCCHPYDPLMCLTLEHSDDFLPVVSMGRHQLIGMTKQFDGVPSAPLVHKRLVEHLLFALRFIPTVAHARRSSSDSSI